VQRTAELTTVNQELQNTQAEVQSQKDRLQLLLDLTTDAVSNLEISDLLKAVTASVRQIMQSDFAGIGLPDPESSRLRVHALVRASDGSLTEQELLTTQDAVLLRVFRTGELSLGSIKDLIGTQVGNDSLPPWEFETACGLPLLSRNRPLGVMGLGKRGKDPYGKEDIDFLAQVANQIAIAVDNALSYRQVSELTDKLAQEKLYLEDEIRAHAYFEEIVGNSAELRRVLKLVETVAPTDSTVLIYGETGTGKELIARAIHNLSPRNFQDIREVELRRHSERIAGKRALRPRKGCLHWRHRAANRAPGTSEQHKLPSRLILTFNRHPWYCHAIRGSNFPASNWQTVLLNYGPENVRNGQPSIVSGRLWLVCRTIDAKLCKQTIVRLEWSRRLEQLRADFHLCRNTPMSDTRQTGLTRRELIKNTGKIAAAAALANSVLPGLYAGESNTIQLALVGCGGRGTGAAENALATTAGPTKLVAMADVFPKKLADSYKNLKGDGKRDAQIDVPKSASSSASTATSRRWTASDRETS